MAARAGRLIPSVDALGSMILALRSSGGSGGRGGHVLMKCTKEVTDFRHLQHVVAGGNATSGKRRWNWGSNGHDQMVLVPLGTVIHLYDGYLPKNMKYEDKDATVGGAAYTAEFRVNDEEAEDIELPDEAEILSSPVQQRSVAELLESNATVILAAGGKGGRGSARVRRPVETGRQRYKTVPELEEDPGKAGSEATLVLELKPIADVGLVGVANAGKSTLLAAMSNDKPSVPNLTFTTLRPTIGRVEYEDGSCISVADVPGGDGVLGDRLLRHLERTKFLVYVLDAENRRTPALEQLEGLLKEMEEYRAGLTKWPSLVVLNKIDKESGDGNRLVTELQKGVKLPVYATCAVLGEGVDELKEGMKSMYKPSCKPGSINPGVHPAKVNPWRMWTRALHWEGKKTKSSPLQERKMVDRCIIRVRGGHGGSGSNSWRKSRHARYGRVDGGSGGVGGNVILESIPDLFDFSGLQHLVAAGDGSSGTSKKKIGSAGEDEVLQVPLGTVVHLCEGTIPTTTTIRKVAKRTMTDMWKGDKDWIKLNEIFTKDLYPIVPEDSLPPEPEEAKKQDGSNEDEGEDEQEESDEELTEEEMEASRRFSRPVRKSNIAELLEPYDRFLVAVGGAGGRGNSALPRGGGREKGKAMYENEPGDPGSEAVLILELKTIADIGLVGAPNVGKSTLLGAISRARPSVGNYAFTTLRPSLGRVEYEDFYALTVADIPGLITGAHQDKGLGFDFLRHVERTKAFAYVVDASLGVGERRGPYAWDQLEELMHEMECYRPGMTKRRSLVIANKVDEQGADAVVEELKKRVKLPVFPTCAVLGEGIQELKEGLRAAIDRMES